MICPMFARGGRNHPPIVHSLSCQRDPNGLEGCLGMCVRCLEVVLKLSGWCLKHVRRVSEGCLEGVWRVFGRCLDGVPGLLVFWQCKEGVGECQEGVWKV